MPERRIDLRDLLTGGVSSGDLIAAVRAEAVASEHDDAPTSGACDEAAGEAARALAAMDETAPVACRRKPGVGRRVPRSTPPARAQGFAGLAGAFDYDPAYDFRAVPAHGGVTGDASVHPGPTAAEVANALQKLARDNSVPAHRRRLVAALADAIAGAQLHGGDTEGDAV